MTSQSNGDNEKENLPTKRKKTVRGASLPTEALELGFWALMAQIHPPEATAAIEEEQLPKSVLDPIAKRFAPNVDELLANARALKAEVEKGRSLVVSLDEYEKARARLASRNQMPTRPGQAAWPPGAQTISARIGNGSWAEALEKLGIDVHAVGRRKGTGRLTEDDFTQALRQFVRQSATQRTKPTYAAYCQWAKEQRADGIDRPSGSTVRQRYLTWSAALQAAESKK